MLSKKVRISLLAALLFFIVANPKTYKIMRGVVGDWIASPTGCPTTDGLVLHTGVYLLITYLLMGGDRELMEGEEKEEVVVAAEETSVSKGNGNDSAAMNGNGNAAMNGNGNDSAAMAPAQQPLNGSSNKMSSITGADLNGSDSTFSSVVETSSAMVDAAQPIETVSPEPAPATDLTKVLSGTSWKKCGCEDGGEVLVLK